MARTKSAVHVEAVNSILYRICQMLKAVSTHIDAAAQDLGYPLAAHDNELAEEASVLAKHLLDVMTEDLPNDVRRAIVDADEDDVIDEHTFEVYQDSVRDAVLRAIESAIDE